MIKYATRLPPGKGVSLLENGNILKTAHFNMERTYLFMDVLIKHFMRHPDPLVVPVLAYQKLDAYSYSYEMERMGILEKEERSLVDHLGNLVYRHGRNAWQEAEPDFHVWTRHHVKLAEFLKTVVEQSRYHDLHSGNVMMDTECNYRLVDLEGFLKTPLELSENDWITRE